MSEHMITWDQDADGVVTLTMDDPQARVNTMNERYQDAMDAVVDRLETERDTVTGVVLTSAKKTFFAGGDLDSLAQAGPEDVESVFALTQRVKGQLRRLETLGRPVVAAINGTALGAGLGRRGRAHTRTGHGHAVSPGRPCTRRRGRSARRTGSRDPARPWSAGAGRGRSRAGCRPGAGSPRPPPGASRE